MIEQNRTERNSHEGEKTTEKSWNLRGTTSWLSWILLACEEESGLEANARHKFTDFSFIFTKNC